MRTTQIHDFLYALLRLGLVESIHGVGVREYHKLIQHWNDKGHKVE